MLKALRLALTGRCASLSPMAGRVVLSPSCQDANAYPVALPVPASVATFPTLVIGDRRRRCPLVFFDEYFENPAGGPGVAWTPDHHGCEASHPTSSTHEGSIRLSSKATARLAPATETKAVASTCKLWLDHDQLLEARQPDGWCAATYRTRASTSIRPPARGG